MKYENAIEKPETITEIVSDIRQMVKELEKRVSALEQEARKQGDA